MEGTPISITEIVLIVIALTGMPATPPDRDLLVKNIPICGTLRFFIPSVYISNAGT